MILSDSKGAHSLLESKVVEVSQDLRRLEGDVLHLTSIVTKYENDGEQRNSLDEAKLHALMTSYVETNFTAIMQMVIEKQKIHCLQDSMNETEVKNLPEAPPS